MRQTCLCLHGVVVHAFPFFQLKQIDSSLSVLSFSLPLPAPFGRFAAWAGGGGWTESPTPLFCNAWTFRLPGAALPKAARPSCLSSASRAFFLNFLALAAAAFVEG